MISNWIFLGCALELFSLSSYTSVLLVLAAVQTWHFPTFRLDWYAIEQWD